MHGSFAALGRNVATDPAAAPALTLRLGPADPARAGLKGHIEVFGDGGKPVTSAYQPLNAPLKTAMTPGFFRAAAALTDLDGRQFETENTFCSGVAEDRSEVGYGAATSKGEREGTRSEGEA